MLRQGGGGTNKIAQHMQGWSLFRLYSDSRVKARRSLMSARESNVVCIPDQGYGAVRVHPDNARRFDLYTSSSRDQLAIMVGLREDVKPCEAGGSGSGGGGEAGADDDKPVRTRDAATSCITSRSITHTVVLTFVVVVVSFFLPWEICTVGPCHQPKSSAQLPARAQRGAPKARGEGARLGG